MKNTAYRQLGKSELHLSPIGLGCWQFSKYKGLVGKFWPAVSDEETREIIRRSIINGVNWFDTAEAYGWGASEESLSAALKSLNLDSATLHIATKWWPFLRRASSIRSSISRRISALGGMSIDLYQIHQPFSLSSVSGQMEMMAELVASGKIRSIGVSNFSAKQMRTAFEVLQRYNIPLASNQVLYHLLDRRIEINGILDTARELGITIIAYSPLAQGLLTGRFNKDRRSIEQIGGMRRWMPAFKSGKISKIQPLIDTLEQLAQKYEKSISQIVLNWTINFHGDLIAAIPGASHASQAEENALSQYFQLETQDLNLIDTAARRQK